MADTWNVNAAPALPIILEALRNSKGNALYDELQRKSDAGDYSPIEGSWFVDPKETYKANEALRGLKDQREAQPYLRDISQVVQAGFDTDPVYQSDARATLAEYAKVKPNNPLLNEAAKQSISQLDNGLVTAEVAERVQRGETVLGMTLAKLAAQKEGNATIGRLLELSKQNDGMRKDRGTQAWVNASGDLANDPKLAQLARTAQYGVTPEQFSTMSNVYGLNPVDLKTVEAGDEQGRDVHYVFNPRTGQTQGVVGMPQDPTRKATRVSVNPIIQQESAYSKGKGEYLSKREGDIVSNGDAADATLERLSELKYALKKTPSGPLAPLYTAAGKYSGGIVGANKSEVGYAAKADTISKLNTLGSIKTLGPGITNAERDFLMDAQARRSHTRAEQAKIIAIYEKDAKYKQRKRDEIVGNTFGDEARQDPNRSERGVVPKLRGTPATASEYMKKWR